MPIAFLDDDGDLTAKFLITLLNNFRLSFQPRVHAAAHMQQRHTSVCQRSQMIKGLSVRHGQPQDGILSVEATDLVRIGDRPGIDFASRSSSVFHHRLEGESLIDQKPVAMTADQQILSIHGQGEAIGQRLNYLTDPRFAGIFGTNPTAFGRKDFGRPFQSGMKRNKRATERGPLNALHDSAPGECQRTEPSGRVPGTDRHIE